MIRKTDNPLVTVGLFAYNQERFIREAVEAALAQTYSPLEIIISDDCSTDSTFDIIKEITSQYTGIHFLSVKRNLRNMGFVEHVNQVVALANGELIVMMAGDDISLPHQVDVLVAEWVKGHKRALALYSSIIEIDEYGNEYGFGKKYEATGLDNRTLLRRLSRPNFCGASNAYVAAYIKEVPIPQGCVEDLFYYYYLNLLAPSLFIKDSLVKYRVHGKSMSTVIGYDFVYKDKRKVGWIMAALEYLLTNRALWIEAHRVEQTKKIIKLFETLLGNEKIKQRLLNSWLGKTVERSREVKQSWLSQIVCQCCRLLYRSLYAVTKLRMPSVDVQ
jgi:glycosyltransferase involved in cell wall biosynthesis